MATKLTELVGSIVTRTKQFLKAEPRDREEFVEETVAEVIQRLEEGEMAAEDVSNWPDRLNIEETEIVAELVYSQLITRSNVRVRRFESHTAGGGEDLRSGYIGPDTNVTYSEEALTDFFLPRFIEQWNKSLNFEKIVARYERSAELASEYLDDEKKRLALREKNRFEEEMRLVREISELAKSFEGPELRQEREDIYELDDDIETSVESHSLGALPGTGGPRSVANNKDSLEKRNRLLKRRAEKTPEEVRNKIHSRYDELQELVTNAEDIEEDLELLKKEDIFS